MTTIISFSFIEDENLITNITDDGNLVIIKNGNILSTNKITEIKNSDGTQRWATVDALIDSMKNSKFYKEINGGMTCK